jgi:hypothetical protein
VNPVNATIPALPSFLSPSPARPVALKTSHLVRLRGLFQADRLFAVALPEAERLAALNRAFAGVVPKAVARACRVAAIQAETALVFCADGAAASRVRAQAKGVAQALSRNEVPVSALRVKVRADWSLPAPPEKQDLPKTALRAFQALDQDLPDGALKDAVERLLARRRAG